ncbi:unnamed protein product, partial [marine sediment metagenome]
ADYTKMDLILRYEMKVVKASDIWCCYLPEILEIKNRKEKLYCMYVDNTFNSEFLNICRTD